MTNNEVREMLLKMRKQMAKGRALRTKWYKTSTSEESKNRNWYEANIFTECMNVLDKELKKRKIPKPMLSCVKCNLNNDCPGFNYCPLMTQKAADGRP